MMPPPRVVRTYKLLGRSTFTNAAAAIPPRTCASTSNAARNGDMILTSARAKEIAGLNKPPEIRKKIHTLTMRENPNAREINIRLAVFTVDVVDSFDV